MPTQNYVFIVSLLLALAAAPAQAQTSGLSDLAVTLRVEATSGSYANLHAHIKELEPRTLEGLAALLDDGPADGLIRNLVLDRLGWLPFALTADGFFVGNPDLRQHPDFEILTVDGETVLAFASADIVHQPGEVPVSDAPMRFWLRGTEQNRYEAVKYEILPPPPADLAERVEEMTLLGAGMFEEMEDWRGPKGFWECFYELERTDLEILLRLLVAELDKFSAWYPPEKGEVWGGRIIGAQAGSSFRYMGRLVAETQNRLGILPFDKVVDGRFLGFTGGGGTVSYDTQTDDGQIIWNNEDSAIIVNGDYLMSGDDRWRFWLVERTPSANQIQIDYWTVKRQLIEPGYHAGQEIPEAWRYDPSLREH